MPGSCLARREGTPWIFTAVNRPNAILSPPTRILNNARFAAGLSLCRQPKKKSPRTAGSTSARRPPAAHRETDAYAASARGAVLGDAACQCEQGRRLHEGRGVARDQAAAAACFEAAAAQNSPDGQCLLGLCHEKGEGVPQSWENAAFLYRQAADQGFAPAQCNLGWCYEYGKGVPQDPRRASTGTVPLLYRKMPGQSVVSASAI